MTLQPGILFARHYKILELVDEGGFAAVYKVNHELTGKTLALKVFTRLDETTRRQVMAEFDPSLRHDFLLSAAHVDEWDGQVFLVMPFATGGNAFRKTGKMTEREAAVLITQIGGALAYLHARDITHNDIKCNNFLLDDRGNYLLSDLGLSYKSRVTMRKSMSKLTPTGFAPPCYSGPEIFEQKDAEPIKASDIWALGASIWELLTGEVPFGERGGMLQLNPSYPMPTLPTSFSRDLNCVLQKCLSRETWDRPTAAKLVEWATRYLNDGVWLKQDERCKVVTVPPQVTPSQVTSVQPKLGWFKPFLIGSIVIWAGFMAWLFIPIPAKSYEKSIQQAEKSMAKGDLAMAEDAYSIACKTRAGSEACTWHEKLRKYRIHKEAGDRAKAANNKQVAKREYETACNLFIGSLACYEFNELVGGISVATPQKTPIQAPNGTTDEPKSINNPIKEPVAEEPVKTQKRLYFDPPNAVQSGVAIKRIEILPDATKITFQVSGASGYQVYAPTPSGMGNFGIFIDGVEYKLLKRRPEGIDFDVKKTGSFQFSIFFKRIPEDTREMLVKERDMDDAGFTAKIKSISWKN